MLVHDWPRHHRDDGGAHSSSLCAWVQGYLDLDEQERIYKVCGPGVTATERRCSGYKGELEFTGGLSMENDRCTDPNPECAPANRWW
jgi:hypothetical protein